MIHISDEVVNWVKNVLGKQLCKVNGLIYSFGEPDFERPQQLQLLFNQYDGSESFCCGQDGSTLILTRSLMQACNLGTLGKQDILDLSGGEWFSEYVGLRLMHAYSIFSNIEYAYIGLKLSFSNNTDLSIINLGDEIHLFKKIPTVIVEEQGIDYFEIGVD